MTNSNERSEKWLQWFNSPERKLRNECFSELERTEKENWQRAYAILKRFYSGYEPKLKDENLKVRHFNIWESPIYKFMNEVERMFLDDIAYVGTIAFYPLYFAHGFYIDFANPQLKIGIEIDGKAFHNIEKDTNRDAELKKHGWTIYRVAASEIYKNKVVLHDVLADSIDMEEHEHFDLFERYFSSCSCGFLFSLQVTDWGRMTEESISSDDTHVMTVAAYHSLLTRKLV